jgi:hypothetical protein
MDNDLKICNDILYHKTYLESDIVFELELKKIEDPLLRLGILLELYLHSKNWDSKVDKIIKTINLLFDGTSNKTDSEIINIHEYFRSNLNDWRSKNIKMPKKEDLNQCLEFLNWLLTIIREKDLVNLDWSIHPEIGIEYLKLSEGSRTELKKVLLNQEKYEELSIIKKWENN